MFFAALSLGCSDAGLQQKHKHVPQRFFECGIVHCENTTWLQRIQGWQRATGKLPWLSTNFGTSWKHWLCAVWARQNPSSWPVILDSWSKQRKIDSKLHPTCHHNHQESLLMYQYVLNYIYIYTYINIDSIKYQSSNFIFSLAPQPSQGIPRHRYPLGAVMQRPTWSRLSVATKDRDSRETPWSWYGRRSCRLMVALDSGSWGL